MLLSQQGDHQVLEYSPENIILDGEFFHVMEKKGRTTGGRFVLGVSNRSETHQLRFLKGSSPVAWVWTTVDGQVRPAYRLSPIPRFIYGEWRRYGLLQDKELDPVEITRENLMTWLNGGDTVRFSDHHFRIYGGGKKELELLKVSTGCWLATEVNEKENLLYYLYRDKATCQPNKNIPGGDFFAHVNRDRLSDTIAFNKMHVTWHRGGSKDAVPMGMLRKKERGAVIRHEDGIFHLVFTRNGTGKIWKGDAAVRTFHIFDENAGREPENWYLLNIWGRPVGKLHIAGKHIQLFRDKKAQRYQFRIKTQEGGDWLRVSKGFTMEMHRYGQLAVLVVEGRQPYLLSTRRGINWRTKGQSDFDIICRASHMVSLEAYRDGQYKNRLYYWLNWLGISRDGLELVSKANLGNNPDHIYNTILMTAKVSGLEKWRCPDLKIVLSQAAQP